MKTNQGKFAVAHRQPDIGFARIVESSRKDAGDAVRGAIDGDFFSNNRWIGAITTLPQAVADQRDMLEAQAVVSRLERSAESRMHIQQRKHVGSRTCRTNFLRAAPVIQIGVVLPVSGYVLERMRAGA